MIDSAAAVVARVRALGPEQQSLLILRLREHVRRGAAAPPSPSSLPANIDELSDAGVEQLLTQVLAADSEAAAAVAAERNEPVEQLSDDQVLAMLTTLLQEERE